MNQGMDKSRVFISWAGELSRGVGEALRDWLPLMFDGVDPWMSARDLDKGRQWQHEIISSLRSSQFGIVCLTPENLVRPWLLFEAGAISTLPQASVFTFLHKVEYPQVTAPLSMFNHTQSRQEDVQRMVFSLNCALDDRALTSELLEKKFRLLWPDLEARLNSITIGPATFVEVTPRGQESILSEVLTLSRDMSRNLGSLNAITFSVEPESRTVRSIVMSRFSTKLRELGVQVTQMSMPVENPGGITVRLAERQIEVSIGDAADFVDGILKPVEFLRRLA